MVENNLPRQTITSNGHRIVKRPSILYLALAHHPPSKIHRTIILRIGRFQQPLCARCLGQFVSTVIITSLQLVTGLNIDMPHWLIISALCPLPSIIDWTTQTIGRRESTNWLRVLTGAIFGVSVALGLTSIIRMEFQKIGLLIPILLVYMTLITFMYKRAGVLDSYLNNYEEFVE